MSEAILLASVVIASVVLWMRKSPRKSPRKTRVLYIHYGVHEIAGVWHDDEDMEAAVKAAWAATRVAAFTGVVLYAIIYVWLHQHHG